MFKFTLFKLCSEGRTPRAAQGLAGLLALAVCVAFTPGTVTAQVPTCGDAASVFEIDGDLAVDVLLDWYSPSGPGFGGIFTGPNADPDVLTPGVDSTTAIWMRDGNFGNNTVQLETNIFDGGSNKNNDNLEETVDPWTFKAGGGIPQKNDITDVTVHTRVIGGDRWMFFSMATRSESGASYADIEFNLAGLEENTTSPEVPGGADGIIIGNGPDDSRTSWDLATMRPRDFILSVDFTNGGAVDRADFLVWQPDGAGGYEFGQPAIGTVDSASIFICTNNPSSQPFTGSIPAPPWGAIGKDGAFADSLKNQQFAEFAVNLGAFGFIDSLLCGANSTITFKSRSSPSFTAELKDLIIVPFNIVKAPICLLAGRESICEAENDTVRVSSDCTGSSIYSWTVPLGLTVVSGGGALDDSVVVNGPPGSYEISVTVNCDGCESELCTYNLTINQDPTPTVDNVCEGDDLCVNESYASYAWSTGATTQCLSSPSPGTYTVTVTTSAGCTGSTTGTVYANPTPTVDNVCAGDDLCVNESYSSYAWSTGATTQCLSSPSPGTYTVTVTDGNGCTGTTSGTVYANPTPIVPNVCQGDDLCLNDPYASMAWSTGATTQCLSSPSPGTYTVTVTDGNGCTAVTSGTVYANPTPTIDPICVGDDLCVNETFAAYAWSTGATTQCLSSPGAGTYTVTVTDGNGCTAATSGTVSANAEPTVDNVCEGDDLCVNETFSSYAWSTGATTQCLSSPSAGTYTVTVTTGAGCTGTTSGTVYANPTPIVPPVCQGDDLCLNDPYASMAWSTGATTQCLSSPSPGTYTVTVTDGNGCTAVTSGTVYANPTPTIDPICVGDDLCVNETYAAYAWSTGATTQCLSSPGAGTYTVTVTDSNGCTAATSGTVSPNPTPTVDNVCADEDLCVNESYSSYAWSNGATTQCISPSAGTYTVTVTDPNGCTGTTSGTVYANPTPTVDDVCADEDLCVNESYSSYAWSTGATTQCLLSPGAGTYTVTVTDSNGCTASTTGTVNDNPVCTLNPPDDPPQCDSSGNTLMVSVSGGESPYSYVWSIESSPPGWAITGGQGTNTVTYDAGDPCIEPDPGATFRVIVTDAFGCVDTCEVTFCSECPQDVFCSVTQGYWGNPGGLKCYDGSQMGTLEILQALITPASPLVIGKPGRSFTIPDGAEQCIIDRLPGGGPPQVLPDIGDDVFSYPSCDTDPGLPKNNRTGRWRNVLLAQTVTLALNVRLDSGLGNLTLCKYITTAPIEESETTCDFSSPTLAGTPTTYHFPEAVFSELAPGGTVYDLLELANCALAGQATTSSLAEIADAATVINEAFDECRLLVSCSNQPPTDVDQVEERDHRSEDWWWTESWGMTGATPKQFGLLPAFPNPLRATSTKIRFALPEASKVQLMVFDVAGRVAATLVDDVLDAGFREAELRIDEHRLSRGIYFYRMEAVGVETGESFVETRKMVVLQ